jgi:hypothetical protein
MSNPQEIHIVTTEEIISRLRDIYRETPPTDKITMSALRGVSRKPCLNVSINGERRFALLNDDVREMVDILNELVDIGILRADDTGRQYSGRISFCNECFRNPQ